MAFPAASLHAATQVHIFNIPRTDVAWNQLLTVPKFNPFNGTLTMVVVRITASYKAKVDVENLATNPAQLSATEHLTVNVAPTPPVMWNLDPITKSFTDSAVVSAKNGSSNFTGPDTVYFSNESRIELSRDFTEPGDLSQFTVMGGSNTWDIVTGAVGTYMASSDGGDFQSRASLKAGLKIKIKYCYNIPEPGTCALLALGMLLVGRRTRRRGV